MKKKTAGKAYRCIYASKSPVINGNYDKKAWNRAQELELILPVSFKKPLSRTTAKMMWDRKCLYVVFKAYDKDVWSCMTGRDSSTWMEDVLEVFIKTHPKELPYYNFEINALNTVYDAFTLRRGAGGPWSHRWSRWDCRGLRSKVSVKGRLNDPSVEDEYWVLEMAVPFKSLPTMKNRPPAAGDRWLFNLSRYDYSVHLPEGVEKSACSRLTKVDFHRFQEWMTLEFVK